MARSANMQALTNDFRAVYPGVVVYGIGDEEHKLTLSDHNEDDIPGSKSAQTDADSNPEHRAIDAMIGPAFTKADAYRVINSILADSMALARLQYIIFDGWIWSRSNGWRKTAYNGSNKHTDHIHFSGNALDDENGKNWPSVINSREGSGMARTLTDDDIDAIVRQTVNAFMNESTDAGFVGALNSPLNRAIAQSMTNTNADIHNAIKNVDAKLTAAAAELNDMATEADINVLLARLTRIENKLDAIFSGTGMSSTDLHTLMVSAVKQAGREGSVEE